MRRGTPRCHKPILKKVELGSLNINLLPNTLPLLQVRFGHPIFLTGVKVGGVLPPSEGEAAPYVRIFARDLNTLAEARFAPLTEPAPFPESGTKAVPSKVRGKLL